MKRSIFSTAIAAVTLIASNVAVADSYEVTITNITPGVQFTPIMVASHKKGVSLFTLGSLASDGIERIAEGGDISVMSENLGDNPLVADIADSKDLLSDSGGLLYPGASVTVTVDAPKGAGEISIAAMLLPTNDAFVALRGVKAPKKRGKTLTYTAVAYDAGTEPNDELCINIPGPDCGGVPFSPGVGGEDFIHIHSGIHGVGNLPPAVHGWLNPTAEVSITRIK